MNINLRVLHFYKTSLPQSKGGIELFIDTLCNTTANYGIKNTVLSLAKVPARSPLSIGNYTVHHAKQNLFIAATGFSISAFAKFKKLATEADIIHYYFPNPFADILHLACRIKKPSIVTYHSDIIRQKTLLKFYTPLMHKFLKSVDHIVFTSPNYFITSQVLQCYHNKVSLIPIGIDAESYPKLNPQKLLYWKNKLPHPFFLFIGVLRYYKGLHIALDAIKGTPIQLAIAGANGLEQKLQRQVEKNKMANAHFLGFITDEDKVVLLHLCHGFVFPSHLRSEAFGISLLEAAMYGKPLISCDIGTGTSYVNIHRHTGLVIAPASKSELRQAMIYLLENPDKAAAFGKNARNRYKELFTADKQTHAYLNAYHKLLKR